MRFTNILLINLIIVLILCCTYATALSWNFQDGSRVERSGKDWTVYAEGLNFSITSSAARQLVTNITDPKSLQSILDFEWAYYSTGSETIALPVNTHIEGRYLIFDDSCKDGKCLAIKYFPTESNNLTLQKTTQKELKAIWQGILDPKIVSWNNASLSAYFKFDENDLSQQIKDYAGNPSNHNGTISGTGCGFRPGASGNAGDYAVYVNNSCYYSLANPSDLNSFSEIEINMAVKPVDDGVSSRIMGYDANNFRVIANSGRFGFYFMLATTDCNLDWWEHSWNFDKNAWQFLTIGYNGSACYIMKNGTLILSQAGSGAYNANPMSDWRIGGDTAGGGTPFNGSIDCLTVHIGNTLSDAARADAYNDCFHPTAGDTNVPATLNVSVTKALINNRSVALFWNVTGNYTNSTVWKNISGTWTAIFNQTSTYRNITGLSNNTVQQFQINVTFNSTVKNTTGILFYTTDQNAAPPCQNNLQNTSWSSLNCLLNDLYNQSRITYDANYCGNFTNVTFYQNATSCNYCSYNAVYSEWTAYSNDTCGSRTRTSYDSNFITCYNITRIAADKYLNDTSTGNYTYTWSEELACSSETLETRVSAIEEEVKMIALILLYAIFLYLGINLILRGQRLAGISLLGITIGMDFYLIWYFLINYILPSVGQDWGGVFVTVFGFSTIFWILAKLTLPFTVKMRI